MQVLRGAALLSLDVSDNFLFGNFGGATDADRDQSGWSVLCDQLR